MGGCGQEHFHSGTKVTLLTNLPWKNRTKSDVESARCTHAATYFRSSRFYNDEDFRSLELEALAPPSSFRARRPRGNAATAGLERRMGARGDIMQISRMTRCLVLALLMLGISASSFAGVFVSVTVAP